MAQHHKPKASPPADAEAPPVDRLARQAGGPIQPQPDTAAGPRPSAPSPSGVAGLDDPLNAEIGQTGTMGREMGPGLSGAPAGDLGELIDRLGPEIGPGAAGGGAEAGHGTGTDTGAGAGGLRGGFDGSADDLLPPPGDGEGAIGGTFGNLRSGMAAHYADAADAGRASVRDEADERAFHDDEAVRYVDTGRDPAITGRDRPGRRGNTAASPLKPTGGPTDTGQGDRDTETGNAGLARSLNALGGHSTGASSEAEPGAGGASAGANATFAPPDGSGSNDGHHQTNR